MDFSGFQSLCEGFDVSRETFDRLKLYESELLKWNPKINLISPATVPHVWERHFLDSLQIAEIAPKNPKTWADLGSGGGFPGLVLAAAMPNTEFTLIESDLRKSAFLRKTAREMGVQVEVISERVESVELAPQAVISARALAPLDALLSLSTHLANSKTTFIFPKGKNWESELTFAQQNWQMKHETHRSLTDPEAKIISIYEVEQK